MLAKQLRSRTVAVLRLLLTLPLVLALSGGAEGKKPGPPVLWRGPVPRADCGPNDRTETGLQGQTTLVERTSGASQQAYNCNLELVGQYTGDGAGWQHAWFDHCAYYGTTNTPAQANLGVVTVDVSDPKNPTATAHLADPAMLEPWESLKVNEKRELLGGVQADGGAGLQPGFALYDVSSDCRHPRLLSSVLLAPSGPRGHAGNFAPDGMTYYGTSTNGTSLYPIDISDPTNPQLITNWIPPGGVGAPHDLSVNQDGTRIYVGQRGNNPPFKNGLTIMDASDFQYRRPNPDFRFIGGVYWEDGRNAQMPTQVRIKGRPYILFTDESGSMAFNREAACAAGMPPYGFARLIDISDEEHPFVTAKLMLEVHDPAHCAATLTDTANPQVSIFRYDSHYCTVDDPNNAKLAACAYFQAGVRVFDIRDPYRPKEVAYYKPGAVGSAARPGSDLGTRILYRDHDWSSSNTRFIKIKGVNYLWMTSQDNGFQVLKFTNHLKHLAPGLFSDDDDDDGGRDRDDDD
jgi:hypothetical protein